MFLRVSIGALIVVAGAFGQAQAPAPCLQKPAAERPYGKDRLIGVVRDQTPSRAEYLIRTCGVAVPWSDGLQAELKAANASDKIVQAVRDMAPAAAVAVTKPPPKIPITPTGPKAGELKTNSVDGLSYSFIPAGTFDMGCHEDEAISGCEKDAIPAHKVRITKGFWMGQTEVTVAAYKRYVAAAGIKMLPEPTVETFNPKWANPDQPVLMASWNDAHNYCRWAGMRLPTEAEWEYAARGPGGGAAPADLAAVAWFADNSGKKPFDSQALWFKDPRGFQTKLFENGNGPHDVGKLRANGWKLFDMLGNASEWTDDFYRPDAYTTLPQDDPDAESGLHHVLRGGSFFNFTGYVRPWKRQKLVPDTRVHTNGFRCAGPTVK